MKPAALNPAYWSCRWAGLARSQLQTESNVPVKRLAQPGTIPILALRMTGPMWRWRDRTGSACVCLRSFRRRRWIFSMAWIWRCSLESENRLLNVIKMLTWSGMAGCWSFFWYRQSQQAPPGKNVMMLGLLLAENCWPVIIGNISTCFTVFYTYIHYILYLYRKIFQCLEA